MANWWRRLSTVVQYPLLPQSLHSQSSLYHTIKAIRRPEPGARVWAQERERAQRRIPGVVYYQCFMDRKIKPEYIFKTQLLTIERRQIQSILKSVKLPFFCSTTFGLQIRVGPYPLLLTDSGTVLPVRIYRDEETGKILGLVFVWADDGLEVKVNVPIVYKGEEHCPGLKKGGRLKRIRTTLKYLCPAEHIPQKIEVDVSNLDIEDEVLMREVDVHPSMKLLSKNDDMPICKIVATNLESPEPAGA